MLHFCEKHLANLGIGGNKTGYVAGYKAGGKSGTSQRKQALSDEEQTYYSSYWGFAPVDEDVYKRQKLQFAILSRKTLKFTNIFPENCNILALGVVY